MKVLNIKACSRCGKHREITKHHILPQTFFGSEGQTVCLCHECHIEIEKLYLRIERAFGSCRGRFKLPAITYYQIFVNFLTGVSDECYSRESGAYTSTRKKSYPIEA